MKEKYKEFVVYKITNIINGMHYFGITGDYERRMRNHFNANGDCQCLHRAIKKYGKEKFTTEIVFECDSWDGVCKEEKEYIKVFDTKFPNGYNLTDGGEGSLGYKYNDESRAKMSKSAKNRKASTETKAKMSKSQKGKTHTKKSRAKMSKIAKNMSDAHKRKISISKQKFSIGQVIEIKKLLDNGVSQTMIAKKFDVTQFLIWSIKAGKQYNDVQFLDIIKL